MNKWIAFFTFAMAVQFASASQDFTCTQMGSNSKNVAEKLALSLNSTREIEVAFGEETDGIYQINSAPQRILTPFISAENWNVEFVVEGEMFLGRRGTVRKVVDLGGGELAVTSYFCRPGWR